MNRSYKTPFKQFVKKAHKPLRPFRRYVQAEKIDPTHVVGRNQFFATKDLKSFKRSMRKVKGS